MVADFGGSASYQRWTPNQVAHSAPHGEHPPAKPEDLIVPKLGTGPQQRKYTVQQMLGVYAELCEGKGIEKELVWSPEGLLDEGSHHAVLTLVDALAQQMVRSSSFAVCRYRSRRSTLDVDLR